MEQKSKSSNEKKCILKKIITKLTNKKIKSYLKTWKRIEKLLLKEINNHEQEKAISEYILQLYNKQSNIESSLRYLDIIKVTDDLSQWPIREIQDLLKK